MIAFGAGTLIGDAVLHLIPLAIMDEDTTSASVGAFILAGVFLFFLTEKALHHHHHNYYDHHNQEDLELEETRSGDGLRQKKQGKKVARASSSADRNDDTSASASNSTTATSTLLDTISAPRELLSRAYVRYLMLFSPFSPPIPLPFLLTHWRRLGQQARG